MNKFLHVDLSRQKVEYGTPSQEIIEQFIGGKGAGLKLLVDMGLITQDPFAAENPVIFITGPFTGSLVQTSARSALVTKSPLTGTFLDSHAGGNFGPMLKRTGVDYIIITGASKKPVYLYITPAEVRFEDASHLWGKGLFETEKILRESYPKSRTASIGPGGENRVRFACIGTDYYRQFGRGGSGAVMGSKNLKAVVLEGQEKIEYADRNGFMVLNKQLTEDIRKHPNRQARDDLGTNMWIRMGQEIGKFLPTRNFQDVQFESYESITSESMKKSLNWKSVGCFNCIIKCSKLAKWAQYEVEGPEYETTAYLGSGCGIGDPVAVAYANYLADDLGLDTISAGVVISFAMEAFEKGILDSSQTGGLELTFGSSDAQHALLKKIAFREGLGDLLAEGTRIASKKIGGGSEYFAIQTAGMELSGVNIKGSASMGLALAAADFASHTRAWSASMEMSGELDYENTPEAVISILDSVNTRNSLIVCDFLPYDLDRLAPILEKVTGYERSEADLMKTGERIANLARMVNLANGRTRKDDILPQRFFKEKHLSGIFKDRFMTEDIFNQWLDALYLKRGWDKNGVPGDKILEELQLGRLA